MSLMNWRLNGEQRHENYLIVVCLPKQNVKWKGRNILVLHIGYLSDYITMLSKLLALINKISCSNVPSALAYIEKKNVHLKACYKICL